MCMDPPILSKISRVRDSPFSLPNEKLKTNIFLNYIFVNRAKEKMVYYTIKDSVVDIYAH